MHRHMRRIGHQTPLGVKHRAGKIQPLFNVHRIGGVLQRHAHLLGDGHEQIVENLQQNRIRLGAYGDTRRQSLNAGEHNMVSGVDFRLPARLNHNGLVRFNQQSGAAHDLPAMQIFAQINLRLMPLALREKAGVCG